MVTLRRHWLISSLVLLLPACATMVRGTEQGVVVNSVPPGATVQVSNGVTCVTPCTFKAARNQSLTLTISKEGCHSTTAAIVSTLAGSGVILGGLIDYGTGAVYDLQPNPLTVSLVCEAKS